MNKKQKRGCNLIKKMTGCKIKIDKGILNSLRVNCDKSITRGIREKLEKQFKKERLKVVWGDRCLLLKS